MLRPGGLALFSTHGVIRYHPIPVDYWRWTHTGLEKLTRDAGAWDSVDVHPNGGTASTLAFLIGREIDVLASQAGLSPLIRPAQLVANVAAWNADRAARRLWPERPPDMSPTYVVAAVRASTAS